VVPNIYKTLELVTPGSHACTSLTEKKIFAGAIPHISSGISKMPASHCVASHYLNKTRQPKNENNNPNRYYENNKPKKLRGKEYHTASREKIEGEVGEGGRRRRRGRRRGR